ncbi:MAG: 3,5-nucleoside bisphosphate phosphatase [Clostridia bacterium]|nr:3,5-nucleoside bisphosphate phosphatase [Clostridia bacterium]
MLADLHVHSSASDGIYSSDTLVELARQKGLTVLGLTDHDTVEGIDSALEAGRKMGVEVVPGVELSTDWKNKEVHILGYYLDYRFEGLLVALKKFQTEREKRVQNIVDRLRFLGYELTSDDVFKVARGEAVGRPHIAQVLVTKGYFETIDQVFNLLLDRGRPAYVPRFKLAPQEAIKIVLGAGGVPVLAHPGLVGDDSLICRLKSAGLQGLEVFYPQHTPQETERYLRLARELNLVVTGGSDFHGFIDREHADLGATTVGSEEIAALRARARGNKD